MIQNRMFSHLILIYAFKDISSGKGGAIILMDSLIPLLVGFLLMSLSTKLLPFTKPCHLNIS